MRLERVRAAVGQQTAKMNRLPAFDGVDENRIRLQIRLADAHDVLIDDAPRADVQMPHLGVPHLPFRQPDREARGVERGPRAVAEEGGEARFLRRGDGVVLGFAAAAEAIEDDENDERTLGHRKALDHIISAMKTRDEALALLHEYTKTDSLRKHALAVEQAMKACARKYAPDEDPVLWGMACLLHDFDYE